MMLPDNKDRPTSFTQDVLSAVELPPELGLTKLPSGKVRDRYLTPDNDLILITTDRISAFDSVLGTIPGKGEVLTRISAFWFEHMKDIMDSHMIAVPDPSVMVCRNLTTIPVEVVVRGYITGVTDTSIWGSYAKGEREIYGIHFREGYQKNDRLDEPIITPTTKAEAGHDERLTEKEITDQAIVDPETWKKVRTGALFMFHRAQEIARKRGFILADAKMEFGVDEEGNLYVIDELFTPDSSRFWRADTYEKRIIQGLEPENYDKEYLRIALKKLQTEKQWKIGDQIPEDIRAETARRYLALAEAITGVPIAPPMESPKRRIPRNILRWLAEQTVHTETRRDQPFVVIMMGSEKDRAYADTIAETLDLFDIPYEFRQRSAHKDPLGVLEILEKYEEDPHAQAVIIAVAGKSNALGAIADAGTIFPVISAPPLSAEDWYDVFSSLRMPSGIGSATVWSAQGAALHAIKILALTNPVLAQKVRIFHEGNRKAGRDADAILGS